MDEPLSNLDAKLRVQMRAELISLHHRLGITTIYVTHDQTEAMTLGDRVAVLNQRASSSRSTRPTGSTGSRPTRSSASFIGSPSMNFLDGTASSKARSISAALASALPDRLRQRLEQPSGDVIVGVRPEDFFLASNGSAAAPFSARDRDHREARSRDAGAPSRPGTSHRPSRRSAPPRETTKQQSELSDTLVVRFDSNTDISVGEHVQLTVNPERVQLFDPGSGDSLLR